MKLGNKYEWREEYMKYDRITNYSEGVQRHNLKIKPRTPSGN